MSSDPINRRRIEITHDSGKLYAQMKGATSYTKLAGRKVEVLFERAGAHESSFFAKINQVARDAIRCALGYIKHDVELNGHRSILWIKGSQLKDFSTLNAINDKANRLFGTGQEAYKTIAKNIEVFKSTQPLPNSGFEEKSLSKYKEFAPYERFFKILHHMEQEATLSSKVAEAATASYLNESEKSKIQECVKEIPEFKAKLYENLEYLGLTPDSRLIEQIESIGITADASSDAFKKTLSQLACVFSNIDNADAIEQVYAIGERIDAIERLSELMQSEEALTNEAFKLEVRQLVKDLPLTHPSSVKAFMHKIAQTEANRDVLILSKKALSPTLPISYLQESFDYMVVGKKENLQELLSKVILRLFKPLASGEMSNQDLIEMQLHLTNLHKAFHSADRKFESNKELLKEVGKSLYEIKAKLNTEVSTELLVHYFGKPKETRKQVIESINKTLDELKEKAKAAVISNDAEALKEVISNLKEIKSHFTQSHEEFILNREVRQKIKSLKEKLAQGSFPFKEFKKIIPHAFIEKGVLTQDAFYRDMDYFKSQLIQYLESLDLKIAKGDIDYSKLKQYDSISSELSYTTEKALHMHKEQEEIAKLTSSIIVEVEKYCQGHSYTKEQLLSLQGNYKKALSEAINRAYALPIMKKMDSNARNTLEQCKELLAKGYPLAAQKKLDKLIESYPELQKCKSADLFDTAASYLDALKKVREFASTFKTIESSYDESSEYPETLEEMVTNIVTHMDENSFKVFCDKLDRFYGRINSQMQHIKAGMENAHLNDSYIQDLLNIVSLFEGKDFEYELLDPMIGLSTFVKSEKRYKSTVDSLNDRIARMEENPQKMELQGKMTESITRKLSSATDDPGSFSF